VRETVAACFLFLEQSVQETRHRDVIVPCSWVGGFRNHLFELALDLGLEIGLDLVSLGELGPPALLDDKLRRLPGSVQLPMPARTGIGGIENRVIEKWINHGQAGYPLISGMSNVLGQNPRACTSHASIVASDVPVKTAATPTKSQYPAIDSFSYARGPE
jgi:hypothetical protein